MVEREAEKERSERCKGVEGREAEVTGPRAAASAKMGAVCLETRTREEDRNAILAIAQERAAR